MNAQYKTDQWTIPPLGTVTVNRTGEFLTCLDASAPFAIRLSDAPQTDFEKGITFASDVPFHKVDLVNTSDAPLTVTIAIGRGSVRDARFVVAGAISTREQLELRPVVYSEGIFSRGSTAPSGSDNELIVPSLGWATVVGNNPLRQSVVIDILFDPSSVRTVQFYVGSDGLAGQYPYERVGNNKTISIVGGGFVYIRNGDDFPVSLTVHEVVHV